MRYSPKKNVILEVYYLGVIVGVSCIKRKKVLRSLESTDSKKFCGTSDCLMLLFSLFSQIPVKKRHL